MSTIQQGKTKDVGTKFWQICNDQQVVIAEFNRNRFPHILCGVDVYFIDLDLDRLCENVQVVADVNGEIQRATPAAGIQNDAQGLLMDYLMSALFHALSKQGSARTKYLVQLRKKMNAVRSEAEALGSGVTLEILANNGIG